MTAAPAAMTLWISAAERTPGVPVHSPPLAPSVNSQPAVRQEEDFIVNAGGEELVLGGLVWDLGGMVAYFGRRILGPLPHAID